MPHFAPNIDAGPVGGETPGIEPAPRAVIEALDTVDVLLVISHGNALRAAAHLLTGHEDEDYANVLDWPTARHVLQSNSGATDHLP